MVVEVGVPSPGDRENDRKGLFCLNYRDEFIFYSTDKSGISIRVAKCAFLIGAQNKGL
jgi:hypothetical protein